jgi:hypothetical protein
MVDFLGMKIYIDPKIVDAANGITYTNPTLIQKIMDLLRIKKFEPKRLESVCLMDLIPRTTHPKSTCKIEGVLC